MQEQEEEEAQIGLRGHFVCVMSHLRKQDIDGGGGGGGGGI